MTEFKVDDRVRYVHDTNTDNPPTSPLNTAGTIYAVYTRHAPYPYAVRTDEGHTDTFNADELELVHPIARTHQVRP